MTTRTIKLNENFTLGHLLENVTKLIKQHQEKDSEAANLPITLEEFQSQSNKAIESGDITQVFDLITRAESIIFRENKDLSSIINIVLYFAQIESDLDLRNKFFNRYLQFTHNLTNEDLSKKFRLLSLLYNSFEKFEPLQGDVLLAILDLVEQTKKVHLILNFIKNIEAQSARWNIDPKKLREIYKKLINVLRQENKHITDRFDMYTIFLNQLGQDKPENQVQENSVIKTIIVDVVQNILINYDFDEILQTLPVQTYLNENKDLKDLLGFIISGQFKEFDGWVQSKNNFLQEIGLEKDTLKDTIRYYSIINLSQNNRQLSYNLITEALQIEENDVERWVIKAIQYNLINAKIDQYKSVVNILDVKRKLHQAEDWNVLSKNVSEIRQKFENILAEFRKQQTN